MRYIGHYLMSLWAGALFCAELPHVPIYNEDRSFESEEFFKDQECPEPLFSFQKNENLYCDFIVD